MLSLTFEKPSATGRDAKVKKRAGTKYGGEAIRRQDPNGEKTDFLTTNLPKKRKRKKNRRLEMSFEKARQPLREFQKRHHLKG